MSAIIWFLAIVGVCQFALWSTLGTQQQSDGLWIGVGGSLIFGTLLFAAAKDALRPEAYLTIDDHGIRVPSSGIDIFHWKDIEHVSRRDLKMNVIKLHEVVDLYFRDSADCFQPLSASKKLPRCIEQVAGMKRFSIFLTSLDADPDSIYAVIEQRFKQSTADHNNT
ncbi:MAG: hypothetical protein U1F87_08495 [Kiritimatiellia bacterium]